MWRRQLSRIVPGYMFCGDRIMPAFLFLRFTMSDSLNNSGYGSEVKISQNLP